MEVASSATSVGVKPRRAASDGVDLEVGGGAADGVVDAVLDVDDAGDLLDGGRDAGAELVEELGVVGEELD